MKRSAVFERVFRFLIGGMLGYVINLGVIRILTVGFGSYLSGLNIAFPIASALSIGALLLWGFFYSYYYNFRTDRKALITFLPYIMAMAVAAATNYVTTNIFQMLFPESLNYNIAAGMLLSGVVKFLLYHFVVFPVSQEKQI